MENVTDLKVNQVRVFAADIIPISLITANSTVDKIKGALSFGEIQAIPTVEGKNIIIFQRGELKRDNKLVIINRIVVEPRRIIMDIDGTSKDSNEVYEEFLTIISGVGTIDLKVLRKPLFVAEGTQCIVTLSFSFDSLFSKEYLAFLKKQVETTAESDVAKAVVRPSIALAEITYEIKDQILLDNKVGLNVKEFRISPRPGIPLDLRRYIVASPFDSDTHLKIIGELDKTITIKKSK